MHTPKNIIYYGVPGTGKTHQLQQLMQQYTDDIGNDDFVTDRLQSLSWRELICLVLLTENRLLTTSDIASHSFVQKKNSKGKPNSNTLATITNELNRFSNPDSTIISRDNINHASNSFFDKDASGGWFVMPTALAQIAELKHLLKQIEQHTQKPSLQIQRYVLVSFHQSYGYEEFVEGIRPVIDGQSKHLTYQIQQGAFVSLCEQARQNPTQSYAIFIDEINRANVSKVFGELLTLIETDKRAGMQHATSVKLAYSGRNFGVPSNVDIYATMNIADRSLTPLDSAMRRRFQFIHMLPKPELLPIDIEGVNLVKLLSALNLRISAILGQDFVLGHAAFMTVTSLTALNQLMAEQIIPMLQEYCYNDWQNIRTILADDTKPLDKQFVQENELVKELNISFGKTVYHINTKITSLDKDSYTPIYMDE